MAVAVHTLQPASGPFGDDVDRDVEFTEYKLLSARSDLEGYVSMLEAGAIENPDLLARLVAYSASLDGLVATIATELRRLSGLALETWEQAIDPKPGRDGQVYWQRIGENLERQADEIRG